MKRRVCPSCYRVSFEVEDGREVYCPQCGSFKIDEGPQIKKRLK